MVSYANAPLLTERDEVDSVEGGIDPLSTEPIAEILGVTLSPGVRERQSHPRFLTAMAVSMSLCEGYSVDAVARDRTTPPWLVFEWYVVEGLVRSRGKISGDIEGLPGRNKAATALKDDFPLSAQRYLKTPSVFGFHGIYRQLARNLRIEQDGILGECGFELLNIWAKEQGLDGFTGSMEGTGRRIRDMLRKALQAGLDRGCVTKKGSWAGWSFFGKHLAPYEFGRRERKFLADQFLADPAGFRDEVLSFLISERGKNVWRSRFSERDFHAALVKHSSSELSDLLRAIDLYENFSRLLQDAFEECLYEITNHNKRVKRVSISELGDLPCVKRACKQVPKLFSSVEESLSPFDKTAMDFKNRFGSLAERQSNSEWAQCLMDHHCRVQEEKPPEGKQPWVYCFDDHTFRCRPLYLREKPPRNDGSYVHFYRTNPLWSFADDLRMLQ